MQVRADKAVITNQLAAGGVAHTAQTVAQHADRLRADPNLLIGAFDLVCQLVRRAFGCPAGWPNGNDALIQARLFICPRGSAPQGLALFDPGSRIWPDLDLDLIFFGHVLHDVIDPDTFRQRVRQILGRLGRVAWELRLPILFVDPGQETRSVKMRVWVGQVSIDVDLFPKKLVWEDDHFQLVHFIRGASVERVHSLHPPARDQWGRAIDDWGRAVLIVKHFVKLHNLGIKSYHIALLGAQLREEPHWGERAHVGTFVFSLWLRVLRVAQSGDLTHNRVQIGIMDYPNQIPPLSNHDPEQIRALWQQFARLCHLRQE